MDRGNRLLAALPEVEYGELRSHLRSVRLEEGTFSHAARDPIARIYFPVRSLLAQEVTTGGSNSPHVLVLGRGGMLGLPALFGGNALLFSVTTVIPGEALSLGVDVFHDYSARSHRFRETMERYTLVLMYQIAQISACRATCDLRRQLVRWLLTASDEYGSDALPITHELIARQLAVRRASVTNTLKGLVLEGLIRNERGTITFLDRTGLERVGCDCYYNIRENYNRLFHDLTERAHGPVSLDGLSQLRQGVPEATAMNGYKEVRPPGRGGLEGKRLTRDIGKGGRVTW